MPQFDTTYFVPQIFWFVVCFSVMWAFMSLFVVPRMESLKKMRQASLENLLEKTQNYQEKIENLLEKNKKILEETRQHASQLVYKADQLSSHRLAQALRDNQERYHEKVREMRQFFEHEKAQLKEEVEKIAPAIAETILRKFVHAESEEKSDNI